MLRKILLKTKYFLIVVLVGVLVLTLFPTILEGGSAEQVQSFVTRFYVQCLGRQPDIEGLNEWVGRLLNGSKTGADVAEGFVFNEEFTGRNHSNETFVTILYRAFFNREPDAIGYKAWLERMAGGMSRKSVLDGFLKSQEFAELCNNYGIVPYAGAPTYEYKYNYMENKWEYAPYGYQLKYNYMENKWEYVPENYVLQYNYMENEWEYVPSGSTLKYNYMENEWEYVSSGSTLKYNYMENEWEYAPYGSRLKYNYFEDGWSYIDD